MFFSKELTIFCSTWLPIIADYKEKKIQLVHKIQSHTEFTDSEAYSAKLSMKSHYIATPCIYLIGYQLQIFILRVKKLHKIKGNIDDSFNIHKSFFWEVKNISHFSDQVLSIFVLSDTAQRLTADSELQFTHLVCYCIVQLGIAPSCV